jgi:phosphatidate cytidylyltransferase
VAGAYLGGWPFRLVGAAIALLACFEAYRLICPDGRRAYAWPPLVLALGLPLYLHAGPGYELAIALVAATLATGTTALLAGARDGARSAAAALVLPLYPILPVLYLVWLREWFGWESVAMLFAFLWVGDTAAYAGGRLTGRHPLAPEVSPHKTVEGALWALAFSLLAAWVLSTYVWPDLLGGYWAYVAAFIVWGFGMLGDLFESLLKRNAGVKDSSRLLGEHGGVLDRFDSLLFAAAPLFYLFHWCR